MNTLRKEVEVTDISTLTSRVESCWLKIIDDRNERRKEGKENREEKKETNVTVKEESEFKRGEE